MDAHKHSVTARSSAADTADPAREPSRRAKPPVRAKIPGCVRRGLIATLAVTVTCTHTPPPAAAATQAQTDQAHLRDIQRPSPVDAAVDHALAWLATQQDVGDGHFNGAPRNVATALACLAFMAAGHFPERSRYGDCLTRGIGFLVDEAAAHDGYLGQDGGRMYGQGIGALALCEAYGMMATVARNRRIRDALAPVLQVIINGQIHEPQSPYFGGWRYEPKGNDADLSVSAWQMLALRAAQNCGLPVPQRAVTDALHYVRSTYSADTPGFCYQRGGNSPAMRAAGVVCMLALGGDTTPKDRDRIRASAQVLLNIEPAGNHAHYYYLTYYLATAARMMGGKHREVLLPKLEKALLRLQQDDGQFAAHSGHGPGVYATAFAVICLTVDYRYLPIYQE